MSEAAKSDHELNRSERFFRPRRLGHANLVVGNLDRSLEFYTEVLGLEVAYVQPLNGAGFLSNGNTHHDIGLVEGPGRLGRGRAPGLNHLAFELETEVDLVDGYRRASAAGIEFDRTADHDIAHAVYGRDPDGNEYEIYADVVHDWRAARSGVVTKPKPNWKPGDTPPHSERNYHPDPEIRRVESAVFHPRRTAQAVLVVERFDATLAEYQEVVGLDLLEGGRDQGYAVLTGTCGERSLGLFEAAPGLTPGLHHVGMMVSDEDDLHISIERFRENGGTLERVVEHPSRLGAYVARSRWYSGEALRRAVATRSAPLAGLADVVSSLSVATRH